MAADVLFFRDLTYVLLAVVLGGALAWMARQPLILGYVAGGLAISPLTPGPSVRDVHTFELIAEVGVVLLMFSIGIEFSLRDLLRVKWVAVLGGPLGILLSVGLAVAVGPLLGWGLLQSAAVGMVISVASTMVLTRLLLDRGELHSRHGRVTVGIVLVEDLAVVLLIILLPRLGAFEPGRLLVIGGGLLKAGAILAPVIYLAAKIIPSVLTRVARTRNEELFLLVALAIGLGTAALTQAVGLSLALGAFLAGLMISESDYAHETLARLLPLRDTFVALFFVTIGALIDPRAIGQRPDLLASLVGMIVVGKLLIWTLVVWLFGQPVWTALLAGVGLTQIGEFSYVLIRVARDAGHVSEDVYNATLAASLLTILINAFLVRSVPGWIGTRLLRQRGAAPAGPPDERLAGHVVMCGFGRVGSAVAEALETFGTPYVAIELDPDIVRGLRARGVPSLFGDASNQRILEAAAADRAALAVVALPDFQRAELAVRHLRRLNPTIPILARAHTAPGKERLDGAGATEVIQPELEAASTLIRHALERLAAPRELVLAYLVRFREAMERSAASPAAPAEPFPRVQDVALAAGALADQSLREARIRERLGVTVVAITRADGEVLLHPSAETVLRPGDTVRVFGLPEQIEAFAQEARTE